MPSIQDTAPFRRNQFLHILDGSSYNVFMSMCSVGVIMPAFVKQYTGNALLLTLTPLAYELLSTLPQPWFVFRMRSGRSVIGGDDPVKRYSSMVFLNRVWFIPFALALFFLGSRPGAALFSFFAALALFSVFLSAAGPCWVDLLSLTVPDSIRPTFMGKREMYSRIVGIASSFLVPVFLSARGFPINYAWLFLTASAVMVAGILPSPAFAVLYPMSPQRAAAGRGFASFLKQGLSSLLGNGKSRPLLVMFWGYSLARLGNAFFAPFIIDEILAAFPPERSAFLLSVLNITNLAGMAAAAYLSGRVIQKFGNKANLLVGMAAFLAAYLPLLLFRNFLTAWTGMLFLSYYSVSGYQSALNGLMDSAPAQTRPILTSLNSFINAFFLTGFYFAGSAIAGRHGYGAALAAAAAAMAVLAAASAFIVFSERRNGKPNGATSGR